MVPKVAGKGRSFKGAGLYYLHDKGALSADRVAFTEAVNLPTRDPDTAIRCMAYTAANQNAIKTAAGGSAKGRKLASPVYAYSLSWSPDEQPTPEQMLQAGRDTLKTLGLSEHEALFVSHNDEPHPHLHVIVNRVHPETGIAAKLSNDHLALSEWAEAYEKRQGRILCEQRVENNERRRQKKEFVKDRRSESNAEFYRWRRLRLKESFERDKKSRDDLWSLQTQERDALMREKEKAIAAIRPQIREDTRRFWAATYKAQKQENYKLKLQQATALGRLRTFLKERARDYFRREQPQTGLLAGAFKAVVSGKEQRERLAAKHERERKELADKINQLRLEQVREINATYRKKLDMLKEAQKFSRDQLRDQQTAAQQKRAEAIKRREDYEEWREQQARQKLDEARENAADLTGRKADPQKDFKRAAGDPPAPPRNKSDEIAENKGDITGKKPDPARDFGKAADKPPAPQEPGEDEQDERRKGLFSAFRDLAREITGDRGRDRSKEIKPPGEDKPPGGGKGPKGPKT